jgi:hypothetical protein
MQPRVSGASAGEALEAFGHGDVMATAMAFCKAA